MTAMTVDTIRKALQCERSGCPCRSSSGKVHCPHHDPNRTDQTPSLSLDEGADGTLLWKCFNGCSQDDVTEALRDRGLCREMWHNGDGRKRRPKGKETRYEVRDTEGHMVAVHVRKDGPEGKRLWWELLDGSKGLGGLQVSALPVYGADCRLSAKMGHGMG